ncbi:restriction endonuclease subunit S [Photorhabdus tasmaniensis]|uniref:restriction endonuclease subunit S n=1 Tax=Photorhabdus tasmaniensis TaxID=1004159 RepID=UPI0040435AE3
MKFNHLKIEDVCDFVGGSQPPKSEFIYEPKSGYIRLIQTRDYKTDSFPTYIPASSTKKFCDEFDIMIGRYGPPIFQICRGLKGAYNVALLKAIPKEVIDREFLYYFLKQDTVFKYVDKLSARTGGQTGVDLVSLNKYPIRLPEDIEYQKSLVSILITIDRKISINNRINTELESMVKMLYEYWFVQFDFPDANGKPYKTSDGKMVYNPSLKRKIPVDWEVITLSQIANITMGQSPAGESYNEDGNGSLFFQGSTDFGWLFPIPRQYTTSPARMAKKGDILLSVRAPVGDMNIANADCCIGRGLAALNSKSDSDGFLFYVMKYFKQVFDRRNSEGTTFGSITKNDLHSLKVVYPQQEILKRYDNIVSEYNKMIFSRSLENWELIKLRDWLLPMLMNGQVTVR